MRILGILFILLSAFGCAKKPKANAHFKLVFSGLADLSAHASGGMMIWGKNADGSKRFSRNINPSTSEFSIEIDNSQGWQFVAISWDGDFSDNDPLTVPGTAYPYIGLTRCAISQVTATELQSGDVNLSLSLNNTNCNNTALFGPGVALVGGVYAFPLTEVVSCRTTKVASVSTSSDVCNSEDKGLASSIRVSLATGSNFEGTPLAENPVKRSCYAQGAVATGQASIAEIPRLPANIDLFPRSYVQYFGSEVCDDLDARGNQAIFATTNVNTFYKHIPYNAGSDFVRSFISVDEGRVCAGPAGAITTDTATGSVNSFWYGVCSIAQWDYIVSNYVGLAYSTKNLLLLNDLNHFAGFDPASGTEPPTIPFNPLGNAFPGGATAYAAVFDGNNKRIIGPEFEETSGAAVNDLGVVRRLGATGSIKNLKIVMPMFEFDARDPDNAGVGSVVGYSQGTIDNVHVILGELEGFADVGGIAGVNEGTISNSSYTGDVSGQQNIGGITGRLTALGTIINTHVKEVAIRNEDRSFCSDPQYQDSTSCIAAPATWYQSQHFGGAIGVMESCAVAGNVALDRVSVSGVITASTLVGGLIGANVDATNTCYLNDIRSEMFVAANEPTNSIAGGILGYAQTGSNLVGTYVVVAGGSVKAQTSYADVGGVGGAANPYLTLNNAFVKLSTSSNSSMNTASHTATTFNATEAAVNTFSNYGSFSPTYWHSPNDGYEAPRLIASGGSDCDGLYASTFAGGDGSASNPFGICNAQQLVNINTRIGSFTHYKLKKNIDLSDLSYSFRPIIASDSSPTLSETTVDSLANFQGVFNGNFKWLYGLSATNTSGLFYGIGGSSVVKNLFLSAEMYSNNEAGILAHTNYGKIAQVQVSGSLSNTGTGYSGGVSAFNYGAILGTSIFAKVQAATKVGGMVGYNAGAIHYGKSNAHVLINQNNAQEVGGIVAFNSGSAGVTYFDEALDSNVTISKGTIGQISNYARLEFGNPTIGFNGGHAMVGGSVGVNEGEIANVDNRPEIRFEGAQVQAAWDTTAALACSGSQYTVARTTGTNTQNGITWNIDDLAFCMNGVVSRFDATLCPATVAEFTETPATQRYVPICQFGSFIGKSNGTNSEIVNNASQARVEMNTPTSSQDSYLAPYSGLFIGKIVGTPLYEDNMFTNMPRLRSKNTDEIAFSGNFDSDNLYLSWITSNYHQTYPINSTISGVGNNIIVIDTLNAVSDLLVGDYVIVFGDTNLTASSVTLNGADTDVVLSNPVGTTSADLVYYAESSPVSDLKTMMDISYNFDVSEESEDLDTIWTTTTSGSYWVDSYAYEDVAFTDYYIGLLVKALNQ